MPKSQVDFKYGQGTNTQLQSSISQPRMATYIREAGHNVHYAIQLYLWNARLAGALVFPLHIAEVTLRNAVHDALKREFGDEWHLSARLKGIPRPSHSNTFVDRAVTKASNRIAGAGKPITTDQIVANMSFEFWCGMLHADYEVPIWNNQLAVAFPNCKPPDGLRSIESLALVVKTLRNRVSHHEPVFGTSMNLTQRNSDITNLIRMVSKETAYWVRDHSRVMGILREKPVAPGARPAGGPPARGVAYKDIPVLPFSASMGQVFQEMAKAGKYIMVSDPAGANHLVNAPAICRWTSTSQEDGLVEIDRVTAADLIAQQHVVACTPCKADISLREAVHILASPQTNGGNVDALVLTDDGCPSTSANTLVGIVDKAMLNNRLVE